MRRLTRSSLSGEALWSDSAVFLNTRAAPLKSGAQNSLQHVRPREGGEKGSGLTAGGARLWGGLMTLSCSRRSLHDIAFLKRRPKKKSTKSREAVTTKVQPPLLSCQPRDLSDELYGDDELYQQNEFGALTSSTTPRSVNLTSAQIRSPWDEEATVESPTWNDEDDDALLAAVGLSQPTTWTSETSHIRHDSTESFSSSSKDSSPAGERAGVPVGENPLTRGEINGKGLKEGGFERTHSLLSSTKSEASEARDAALLEKFFRPVSITDLVHKETDRSVRDAFPLATLIPQKAEPVLVKHEKTDRVIPLEHVLTIVDAKSETIKRIEASVESLRTRGEFNKFKHPLIAKVKARPSPSTVSLTIADRPYRLVVNPTLSSVDLQGCGARIAEEIVPVLPAAGYIADLAKEFTARKLRNEPLLKAALWKTFKWDYSADLRPTTVEGGERALSSSSSLVPRGSAHDQSALANLPAPLLHDLTRSTAAMFELMAEQSLADDKELVFIAIGRLVECAPFMLPADLSAVMNGLRHYNKTYLTLSEVLLETSNHNTRELMVDALGKTSLVESCGPQGNVIDFLLDALEKQIKKTSEMMTAEDVIAIMEGLTHTGVRDPSLIREVAKATTRLNFTAYQAGKLLQHTASVHERMVSLLVGKLGGPDAFAELMARDPNAAKAYQEALRSSSQSSHPTGGEGKERGPSFVATDTEIVLSSSTARQFVADENDNGFRSPQGHDNSSALLSLEGIESLDVEGTLTLCAPLFIEAAKKVNHTSLVALSKDNPMLIIELRRMCETNAIVTRHVPHLWEVIRNIHIPNYVLLAAKRRTELGASRLPKALANIGKFKVKSIVDPHVDPRFKIPNHFRKWEKSMPIYDDPNKTRQQQRVTQRQPRKIAFGVRRITKGALLRNEAKRTRGLRKTPQKNWMSKGNFKPQSRGLGRGEGGKSYGY